LVLDGALVELEPSETVRVDRVRVAESELRGLALEPKSTRGLELRDVVLRDRDLSNVDGAEGSLRRVEIHDSKLVGFGLAGGTAQDLWVANSTLALASFAFARLRSVVFESVDLTEASFMQAQLEHVEFMDCRLSGTDFRGVTVKDCAIRGTPLDGVLGVESLSGLTMPWQDVLASAATLATGLGIIIESD
jgi:uncharacterized protein YjbI with pentapeptide repeats